MSQSKPTFGFTQRGFFSSLFYKLRWTFWKFTRIGLKPTISGKALFRNNVPTDTTAYTADGQLVDGAKRIKEANSFFKQHPWLNRHV